MAHDVVPQPTCCVGPRDRRRSLGSPSQDAAAPRRVYGQKRTEKKVGWSNATGTQPVANCAGGDSRESGEVADGRAALCRNCRSQNNVRSEEHTSELQSRFGI